MGAATGVIKQMSCPYCSGPVELVNGERIYPHRRDLYAKRFYLCAPCKAYVGCHPKTTRPLGRLANAELRAWKMRAHTSFDPIWRNGKLSRKEAYAWLAREMGLTVEETHIGQFDVENCRCVVELCSERARIAAGV